MVPRCQGHEGLDWGGFPAALIPSRRGGAADFNLNRLLSHSHSTVSGNIYGNFITAYDSGQSNS